MHIGMRTTGGVLLCAPQNLSVYHSGTYEFSKILPAPRPEFPICMTFTAFSYLNMHLIDAVYNIPLFLVCITWCGWVVISDGYRELCSWADRSSVCLGRFVEGNFNGLATSTVEVGGGG